MFVYNTEIIKLWYLYRTQNANSFNTYLQYLNSSVSLKNQLYLFHHNFIENGAILSETPFP